MANEPPPALWHEKELWVLDLSKGDHLRNTCTWSFPGEAPQLRAQVGRVGRVAKPWEETDPDPELAEAARMLAQWRADSCTIHTVASLEQTLPPAKRARVAAWSPRTREIQDDLLRQACLRRD
jgi:hypothetical protein